MTKRQKIKSYDGALTERVRLFLLRLPSDAILSTPSSSSRGRTNAAW